MTAIAETSALFSVEGLVALLTLTALEIVLGIDNIVFLSILSERVEESRRARARQLGLALALGLRVLLLLCIGWVMGLESTLFTVFGVGITGRDLVLLGGGLFLITKGTLEIHHLVEGHHPEKEAARGGRAAFGTVAQIAVMDLVFFSLDSVITAVGMTDAVPVMIAAVVIAIVVMMVFATPIANFVQAHLPIKTLALAFLVLVGVLLVADGLHQHMPRGYVYFAMAFSLIVELLNLRAMAKRKAAREG